MSGKKPDKKISMISDKKFLKFFDIEYEEGKHYFAVTRRDVEKSFALLSEKEAKLSLPIERESASRKIFAPASSI